MTPPPGPCPPLPAPNQPCHVQHLCLLRLPGGVRQSWDALMRASMPRGRALATCRLANPCPDLLPLSFQFAPLL